MLRGLKSSGKDLPTPLYIVNQPELRNTIEHLKMAFSTFPRFFFGYSFKTNPALPIIQTVYDMGGCAEVVSPQELRLARTIFPMRRIIYNGVIPDVAGKFEVASHGGTVNVENLLELHSLDQYARERDAVIDIGVRLNLDIEGLQPSRFGMEFNDELLGAIKICENLRIIGIHCHVSKAREAHYWKERARQMARIAKQLGCEYIDLGGNMFGHMRPEVAKRYESVPSFSQYAATIHKEFLDVFREGIPSLILEPGTPLAASAQAYLSRVNIIKRVAGMTVVTLDGKAMDTEVFMNPKNRFPYHVLTQSRKNVEDAIIYGSTCTEIDVFATGYTGPMAVGDRILFDNVGAYSNTLETAFICGRPGIASYDEDGTFTVVRAPG